MASVAETACLQKNMKSYNSNILFILFWSISSFLFSLFIFFGLFLFTEITLWISAVTAIISLITLLATIALYFTPPKLGVLYHVKNFWTWPILTLVFVLIHVIFYVAMLNDGGDKSKMLNKAQTLQLYRNILDLNKAAVVKLAGGKGHRIIKPSDVSLSFSELLYSIYMPAMLNYPPPRFKGHAHLLGNLFIFLVNGSLCEIRCGRLGYFLVWLLSPWTEVLFNRTVGLGSSVITYALIGALFGYEMVVRLAVKWNLRSFSVEKKIRHVAGHFLLVCMNVGAGLIDYWSSHDLSRVNHYAHARTFLFGYIFMIFYGSIVNLVILRIVFVQKGSKKGWFYYLMKWIFPIRSNMIDDKTTKEKKKEEDIKLNQDYEFEEEMNVEASRNIEDQIQKDRLSFLFKWFIGWLIFGSVSLIIFISLGRSIELKDHLGFGKQYVN